MCPVNEVERVEPLRICFRQVHCQCCTTVQCAPQLHACQAANPWNADGCHMEAWLCAMGPRIQPLLQRVVAGSCTIVTQHTACSCKGQAAGAEHSRQAEQSRTQLPEEATAVVHCPGVHQRYMGVMGILHACWLLCGYGRTIMMACATYDVAWLVHGSGGNP